MVCSDVSLFSRLNNSIHFQDLTGEHTKHCTMTANHDGRVIVAEKKVKCAQRAGKPTED